MNQTLAKPRPELDYFFIAQVCLLPSLAGLLFEDI